MNFQDTIEKDYVKWYVNKVRRNETKEEIERKFSVWRKQYGAFLPKQKTARVVDVGCGNGEIIYWLKSEGYENGEGIESNEEQIKRGHALRIGDGITKGDFRKILKSKSNYYDCVIARDVIEHMPKEELWKTARIIYESLNESGVFIIQTPNAESPFGSRTRYIDLTHCLSFTSQSITHLLGSAGFQTIDCFPSRPPIHGFASFIRSVLWMCIELTLRTHMIIETGSGTGIFTQNMIVVARK